jgi:OmpA-OmpF porin, OOP family
MKYWIAILLGAIGLLLTWFFLCTGWMAAGGAATTAAVAPVVASGSKSLIAAYAGKKVTLLGVVPSAEAKAKAVAAATAAMGAGNVDDQLRVEQGAPVWTTNADNLFGMKPGFDGRMEWTDGKTLMLDGTVGSDALKAEAAANAAKMVGTGVTIDNRLKVVAVAASVVQQQKVADILKLDIVEFNSGSAKLTPKGVATLNKVAEALSSGTTKVAIAGHTDNAGNDANNLKLSEDRAATTLDYLAGKGIARSRLTAQGFGHTQPIADNATSEGKQRNRRIEFTVSEGK